MKTTAKLLTVSLLLFSLSCKKQEDPDAEKPFIKSISFKNLPDKDVQFDPKQHTITIQIPPVVPDEGFIPILDLSNKTEVIGGVNSSGALNLSAFGGCRGYDKPKPEGTLTLANDEYIRTYRTQRSYRVIALPAKGNLEPITELPITYTRLPENSGFITISLPFKNLYQNPQVIIIGLKNLTTGKGYGYSLAPAGSPCVNYCNANKMNRMMLLYDTGSGGGLPVGSYEISVVTSLSPDRVTFPQPLVIKE